MKAAVTIVLAVLTLALSQGSPASADHTDGVRPGCADIIGGSGNYDGSRVSFKVETAAPSCPGVTYTLNVLDISCPPTYQPCSPVAPAPLTSQSVRGDRTTTVEFAVPATTGDGDDIICVFTTSAAGGRVFDRAPATGCMIEEAAGNPESGSPFDCSVVCDSCNDFVEAAGLILFDTSPATVNFQVRTATASCPETTYTLSIVSASTGAVTTRSFVGDGSTDFFRITATVPDVFPAIPDLLATSGDGEHIFDQAGFDLPEHPNICAFLPDGTIIRIVYCELGFSFH